MCNAPASCIRAVQSGVCVPRTLKMQQCLSFNTVGHTSCLPHCACRQCVTRCTTRPPTLTRPRPSTTRHWRLCRWGLCGWRGHFQMVGGLCSCDGASGLHWCASSQPPPLILPPPCRVPCTWRPRCRPQDDPKALIPYPEHIQRTYATPTIPTPWPPRSPASHKPTLYTHTVSYITRRSISGSCTRV